jgi:hypothetical protein
MKILKKNSTFWIGVNVGLAHQSARTHCRYLIPKALKAPRCAAARRPAATIEAQMPEHWA